jgi:aldose sugar dehydrogenase
MRHAWLVFLGACNAAMAAPGAPQCVLVDQGFGPTGTVPIKVETVVTGLEVPWSIGFLPDGKMLVTERPGRVRLVDHGRLVGEPVATVSSSGRAEGGLLGLAIHPRFAENHLFYLYYTTEEGGRGEHNRVQRWRLSDDGRSARPDKILVDDIAAARFHDGGRLRFGPDGMLYVGTGDATEPPRSQDLGGRNGKVLRLTPDGDVPADNPWPKNPAFVLGVRNVEAIAWRDEKTMLIADHGPSGELGRRGHDEVDVARAGQNLGWPTIYGCEERSGLVTPALTWNEAVPPGGAAVYTGKAIPEWRGSLIVGSLGSRHLHRVVFDGDRVAKHEVYLAGDAPKGQGRLRDVLMGPDDELYVTTSNCDGRGTCPPEKDAILKVTR